MKAYVRTETGSLYLIDGERMTWERLETSEESGLLRTDGGELSSFPEIKVDERMLLFGPPIVGYAVGRCIMTSPVVEVRLYARECDEEEAVCTSI